MGEEKKYFGKDARGKDAYLYVLSAGNYRVEISDYGATMVSFVLDSGKENEKDILLGYDSVADYIDHGAHFGACVGRYANRVEDAKFVLHGKEYHLEVNNGKNCLHSGSDGFDKRVWDVKEKTENQIVLELFSPDGDQGFPGNLRVQVTYTLTDDGTIELKYEADADQDTPFNMTNHAYFNLNGHGSGNILQHTVKIFADRFTPVRDSGSIPTGELAPVEGTPFDFREGKTIGAEIDADCQQLKFAGGYDHNYVFAEEKGEVRRIAEAIGDRSGIRMEVFSDLPGMQFYTGNFLNRRNGKRGSVYDYRTGFAMETQYFPNSINEPAFADSVLKAGEHFTSVTRYRVTGP